MTMQVNPDGSLQMTAVKPTWGYYRQPNGWITISPATDLEELQYRKEGWTPLTQYGRIEHSTGYSTANPLEPLFILGGAHELCVDQLVKTGLALNPPLVPVCHRPLNQFHKAHVASCWQGAQPARFPQLEGVAIAGPFPCRFCGVQKPTEEARDQHEGVAHKEEKGDIRTGESLANALGRALKGSVPAQGPAPDGMDPAVVLKVLSEAGLTKRQREALAAAGIGVKVEHEPS